MQENKEKKKNYKVNYWNKEYRITPLQENEFVNDGIVLECKCGCTYTGKWFPRYKWDEDKEEMVKCGISVVKYYGSEANWEQDYQTCECGARFTEMECIHPKPIKYVCASIRTSEKRDLELDHTYIGNEEKKKHWSDLPGGIQEHEDIHKEKFKGVNGVLDIT